MQSLMHFRIGPETRQRMVTLKKKLVDNTCNILDTLCHFIIRMTLISEQLLLAIKNRTK